MYQWNAVIVIHAALAAVAILLGAILLRARKGTSAHRAAGWVWVISMAAVASLSFAIRRPEGFSWIHGLSIFTLVSLVWGVLCARLHRIRNHRYTMISMYFGALIITGLFTLLPDRLLGKALWGALG